MLIRFSVQNFRSIGDQPVMLNMISSSKIHKHPGHVCPTELPIKVLRDAVIYGANASGKTNLIRALLFLILTVRFGTLPNDAFTEFCRTSSENAHDTSVFDIQFENNGVCFDYGFECFLNQQRIVSEWLYCLNGPRPNQIFSRDAQGISFDLDVNDEDLMRFKIYKEDFIQTHGLNSPQLFLSYLNAGRTFGEDSALKAISLAHSWFINNVHLFGSAASKPIAQFYLHSNLDDVAQLLATFDTGIAHLEKRVISMEDLARYLPHDVITEISKEIAVLPAPQQEDDIVGITVRTDQTFIGIEKRCDNSLVPTVMKIQHAGSAYEFDLGDESDGTKRLFDFIDMILTHDTDTLFVIDELSRSLHPLLSQHFIELFNEVHKNDRCQLVFTTHENDIMSYDYFRRDEIWFVERDENGESHLYPLDEFAKQGARSDARVGKQYMEGRYGGVPVLSLENSLYALENHSKTQQEE